MRFDQGFGCIKLKNVPWKFPRQVFSGLHWQEWDLPMGQTGATRFIQATQLSGACNLSRSTTPKSHGSSLASICWAPGISPRKKQLDVTNVKQCKTRESSAKPTISDTGVIEVQFVTCINHTNVKPCKTYPYPSQFLPISFHDP